MVFISIFSQTFFFSLFWFHFPSWQVVAKWWLWWCPCRASACCWPRCWPCSWWRWACPWRPCKGMTWDLRSSDVCCFSDFFGQMLFLNDFRIWWRNLFSQVFLLCIWRDVVIATVAPHQTSPKFVRHASFSIVFPTFSNDISSKLPTSQTTRFEPRLSPCGGSYWPSVPSLRHWPSVARQLASYF